MQKKEEKTGLPLMPLIISFGIVAILVIGFIAVRRGECSNIFMEKCGERCVNKGTCTGLKLYSPGEIRCVDGTLFKANDQGSRLGLYQRCGGYGCDGAECLIPPSDDFLKCPEDCDVQAEPCVRRACVRGKCMSVPYMTNIDRTGDCKDDCTGQAVAHCQVTDKDKDGDGIPNFADTCPEQNSVFANGCDIQEILVNGIRSRKEMMLEDGRAAGEILKRDGIIVLGSSGAIPKYDDIRARYYYDGVACEEVLDSVKSKLGDKFKIELVQDITYLSENEKLFIYTNWANHLPSESIAGNVLKFPFILFYGPGGKLEDGKIVERFEAMKDYGNSGEKIKGVAPSYVTVIAEDRTCCENCLMFSACMTLIDPPAACTEYLKYPVHSSGGDTGFGFEFDNNSKVLQ